jgi:hypothetical protein
MGVAIFQQNFIYQRKRRSGQENCRAEKQIEKFRILRHEEQ